MLIIVINAILAFTISFHEHSSASPWISPPNILMGSFFAAVQYKHNLFRKANSLLHRIYDSLPLKKTVVFLSKMIFASLLALLGACGALIGGFWVLVWMLGLILTIHSGTLGEGARNRGFVENNQLLACESVSLCRAVAQDIWFRTMNTTTNFTEMILITSYSLLTISPFDFMIMTLATKL